MAMAVRSAAASGRSGSSVARLSRVVPKVRANQATPWRHPASEPGGLPAPSSSTRTLLLAATKSSLGRAGLAGAVGVVMRMSGPVPGDWRDGLDLRRFVGVFAVLD